MKKKVLAICGSTRKRSTNLQIIEAIASLSAAIFDIVIYDELELLPHFNPDLDQDTPPGIVQRLRNKIATADAVLICTPEYVFSLPGSLKNVIEWTVSTTLFSGKPTAIITASGLGEKAHEALQLIIKTIEAKVTAATQLHISGARSKVNNDGITDQSTLQKVNQLITALNEMLAEPSDV